MRNKGAIKLFAIVLALVCIYQLSFTFVTYRVETKAEAQAVEAGDPELKQHILDTMSNNVFLGFTYRECRDRQINLGLDLKGGMNVILEVAVEDVIRTLAANPNDPVFVNTMNRAKELKKESQDDFVSLFALAFHEINPDGSLASLFSSYDMKEKIKYDSSDEDVIEVIRDEADGAIDNTVEVLRARIDQFGVANPNFQVLGSQGRVMIELPGYNDADRVRKLLQETAQLEFWETYFASEVGGFLEDANAKVKELLALNAEQENAEADLDQTEETETTDEVAEVAQDTTQEKSLLEQVESDTTQTPEEQMSEDQIRKEYPLLSILRPNTTQNGQWMQSPMLAYAHFSDTTQINEYLLHTPQVAGVFPSDVKFLWSHKPITGTDDLFGLYVIKVSNSEGKPALGGEYVDDSYQTYGQTGKPEVSMRMNTEGAKIWKNLTRENTNRSIAIVLDNRVRSAPNVSGEIAGGVSSISGGDMDVEEAIDLANVLKSGKLEAPARIISEVFVGPSLGQESINSGLLSFIIAFVVVLIYMLFYYSRAGIVADIALIVNVFFIIGVLASMGAVLTLPGIAGVVLTIGMSVDANVLIYERIREELISGKGIKLALKDGYKNAYSAIIDANVTTLLTGFILYYFGSGPIKGFATTLVIGIFTSLFAAIFLTRLIFEGWLAKDRKIVFATKLTEGAFKNLGIKFLEKRKTFYVISGILIVLSIGSLIGQGLSFGVDFSGGRTYEVRFNQDVSTNDLIVSLGNTLGTEPEVKTYGGSNQVKITTNFMIDSDDPEADNIVEQKIYEGLIPYLPDGTTMEEFSNEYRIGSHKVGPTIADDIIKGAIISIALSLIIIFIYILIRFRNWQYGLGAVAALFHDVTILMGIFSAFYMILPFSMDIDQAFIAAVLTVIGYSINDTVVVFDRVREYVNLYRKRDRMTIMNQALNSTISRTFSTSLSTFVVLLSIFAFGGPSIRGFIFAMMIGVVVGTYSSLFIASPIAYDLIKKEKRGAETPAKKKK